MNLYFVELFFGLLGGGGVGFWVFDIVIEGENKFLNFDIFVEVGVVVVMIKMFGNIIVSDGFLSILFFVFVNNGKILVIEVLGFGLIGDILINFS